MDKTTDIGDLIAKYVALRDKKAEIEKAQKEQLARFKTVMDKIEALILDHFNETGVESARTPAGTAFKSIKSNVRVDDRDAFMAFVRDTEGWAFLESKANKSAVDEYLKVNEALPPGVSLSRVATVNIRRS